jgi:hypothetical protein
MLYGWTILATRAPQAIEAMATARIISISVIPDKIYGSWGECRVRTLSVQSPPYILPYCSIGIPSIVRPGEPGL